MNWFKNNSIKVVQLFYILSDYSESQFSVKLINLLISYHIVESYANAEAKKVMGFVSICQIRITRQFLRTV